MTFTVDQAANLCSVHANESVKIPNSHINFNNTSTINVSIAASLSNGNTVNVQFDANSSVFAPAIAYTQANLAYSQANTAEADAQTAIALANIANNTATLAYALAQNNIIHVQSQPLTNVIQNTLTYFSEPFLVLANTLKNGSTFKLIVFSDTINLGRGGAPLNVVMGPNGNITDNVMFSATLENSMLSMEFLLILQSNANGANIVTCPLLLFPSGGSFILQAAQYGIVDATVNNYIGLTFNSDTNQGNSVWESVIIQQIK